MGNLARLSISKNVSFGNGGQHAIGASPRQLQIERGVSLRMVQIAALAAGSMCCAAAVPIGGIAFFRAPRIAIGTATQTFLHI
jgi:hypothetical protein